MITSDTIGELAGALAKAQGVMRSAKRDGLNTHFGNRYASLNKLIEAAAPALSSNGICVVQASEAVGDEGSPPVGVVTTKLLHQSGEWIESTLAFPLAASLSYQELGKALTYLRRYSLASMIGIASEEDDDGETDRVSRSTPEPAAAPPARRAAPRREPPPVGAGDQTVRGVIADVRATPFGDTTKTAILVDGWEQGWASTFDETLGHWLAERKGRAIEVVVFQKGKFWNVRAAAEVTASGGEVQPPDDIPF